MTLLRPKPELEPQKRVRASEHALTTALKAMQACGLTVDKVSINGGRIEIHCAGGDDAEPVDEYEGLEKW